MGTSLSTRTAAIVVNFARPDLTERCLSSLWSGSVVPELTICVDNGSDDGSVERLSHWADQELSKHDQAVEFAILACASNMGFAAANNTALRWVAERALEFDQFWFLNNDTTPRHDALEHLIAKGRKHPKYGIIGSTLLKPGSTTQCTGGYRYYPALTVISAANEGLALEHLDSLPPPRLDYICGASMLIRAETLSQVGMFDERYFLFCEEVDLAHRIRKSELALHWARASIVHHDIGATAKSTASTGDSGSDLANYHENLSVLRLTWQHYRYWLPLAVMARIAMKLMATVLHQRWSAFGPFCRAVLDFLRDPRGPNSRSTPITSCHTWPPGRD
ncbi:MAG: glycosyl transferase [Lysobacteraceae bacterium]|nr:MAG: glycosyl transferase [Xanthomonadaceae bacterium]